jgi:hypothetical protein
MGEPAMVELVELVVVGQRRFYRVGSHGDLYPSVTTILNAYPKPALTGWLVNVLADYAVTNRRQLWAIAESSEATAVEMIKSQRWQAGQDARNLGTDVHALIAAGLEGDDVTRPYTAAFYQWMADNRATSIDNEVRVLSTVHGWGGQIDQIIDHPDLGMGIVDIKTGRPREAAYADEHLQVAAYRACDIGHPLPIDWTGVLLVSTEGATMHLTSDDQEALVAVMDGLKRVAAHAGMLTLEDRSPQ